jgi:transcriptional regulator with GAF, ATPase, and Fis domain
MKDEDRRAQPRRKARFAKLEPVSAADEAREGVGPTPAPATERGAKGVSQEEREMIARRDVLARPEPPPTTDEVRRLRRLLDLSRRLSSILDHNALLDAILDEVIPLANAERGLILLRENGELQPVRGRTGSGESLPADARLVSQTLAQTCMEENRILRYDNLSDIPELRESKSIRLLDLYSAVCLPLREKGLPFGVLYLDSSLPTLSTQSGSELLEAFAAQAAVCLTNAKLMGEFEETKVLLTRENQDLRAEVQGGWSFSNIIGRSPQIQRVFERVRLIKDLDISVLLLGESGTGKEMFARALHREGRRANQPFVAINCAAVPAELFESELFGHLKGSFTGATEDRPGLIEQADGGTLFLDEVGDMPLPFQVRLLRFLQSGEFRRVGERTDRHADVRIISATNQDLKALIEERKFREDLYYRLEGVRVEIPPLRDRRDDIPLLVDHYFEATRKKHPRVLTGITERAYRLLVSHPWPGNVRQLVHAVQGACALVPEGKPLDEVQLRAHLQGPTGDATAGPPEEMNELTLHDAVSRAERDCLEATLRRHSWNITRAARDLQISRQHLHNRIRVHGLVRPT